MALDLPPGVTFYLARHAETVANREGRFDRSGGTTLTGRGGVQARMVGAILKTELDGLLPRFISSPLPRARATMAIIQDVLGLPHAFHTDPRLTEIGLGSWAGLAYDNTRIADPEAWEQRQLDRWNVPAPGGGESYAMVAGRARSFIGDIEETTVAVSHGAFLRIVQFIASGQRWEEVSEADAPQDCVFAFTASGVQRLEYTGVPPDVFDGTPPLP